MSERLHESQDAKGVDLPMLKSAGWSALMMGVVFAFALDALVRYLARILDKIGVAGEDFPMPGAAAGILLSLAIIALIVGRDVPLDSSLRFLRSVMLLICAILLVDPVARILLHLLAPDFAASLPAFVLRAALALAALGGLGLFLSRGRLMRFLTSGGEPAP